jgi:hypothetical protein
VVLKPIKNGIMAEVWENGVVRRVNCYAEEPK